ncbi:class I SAM-dependent methyltransferase [Agaribacterium haliotis]|uniref:class I SAM-dependent methyltransferase n=1 Tax=Agaribacterium haliotis TaxID=2013869 RepID=UPI000BB53DD5|nr:class I SAM-dependent methyltransferase [Agaribacterium haliotis]
MPDHDLKQHKSSQENKQQEQELRFVAAQLACPSGEAGLGVGDKMNELNRFMTGKTIEALSVTKGECVVEIGPGNGVLSEPVLQALGTEGHYWALEKSQLMAAELQQRFISAPCHVHVKSADCLHVHLDADSVDALMAVNVLYFIDDLPAFFRHIYTWLKPGARVVWGVRSDTALKNAAFTKYGFNIRRSDEIKMLMEEAGFSSVKSRLYDEGAVAFGETTLDVDCVIICAEKPGLDAG